MSNNNYNQDEYYKWLLDQNLSLTKENNSLKEDFFMKLIFFNQDLEKVTEYIKLNISMVKDGKLEVAVKNPAIYYVSGISSDDYKEKIRDLQQDLDKAMHESNFQKIRASWLERERERIKKQLLDEKFKEDSMLRGRIYELEEEVERLEQEIELYK